MEGGYRNRQHTATGIGGVVILFYPNERVFANIRTYAGMVERLWIFDNSESNLADVSGFFKEYANVEIIQDCKNEGIGKRLNHAILEANKLGFRWLITMDQDSYFVSSNFHLYRAALEDIDVQRVALVSVRYSRLERTPDESISFSDAEDFITSGSWINLQAVRKIGLLNEGLFIDEVDTDLFCRTLSGGWKVIVCEGVYMVHSLGTEVVAASIGNKKRISRNIHPPVRLYYITRNYLWVRHRYGSQFPDLFRRRWQQVCNTYKNSLIYGSYRIWSFKMILKGYFDFKRRSFGKIKDV